MKKHLLFLITASFIFFILVGCRKDESNTNNELTEKEKNEIFLSYEKIDEKASAVLLNDGKTEDFEKLVPEIQNYETVEKAWVENNTLWVKYKKGGVFGWLITPDRAIPPYFDIENINKKAAQYKQDSINKPTSNKACIINQVFHDERNVINIELYSTLNKQLQNIGYEVTLLNGEEADVAFFQKKLNEYGVVFCDTHGSQEIENGHSRTWLMTGQKERDVMKFIEEYWEHWCGLSMTILVSEEKRNGKLIKVPYIAISNSFIDKEYNNNSFPNSLIYLTACQGMKTDELGSVLNKKGVGVTVGWDEVVTKSHINGYLIFQGLMSGYSLKQLMNKLPKEILIDYSGFSEGAHLRLFPTSGENMQLIKNNNYGSINVTSLTPGLTFNTRVVNLVGLVNGFARVNQGIVEINGLCTKLEVKENKLFNQSIVINQGENNIKITCYGENEVGGSIVASIDFKIYGDFPALALFSALRWNTNHSDVDIHLIKSENDISQLWTWNDCFYNNSNTSWGAVLDVDDRDGFGPEHISIPNLPSPGKYTLYVHYYDNHGSSETEASIDISVNNGDVQKFGPYKLNNSYIGSGNKGDLWAVCTIEYPSGIITPLNQYYYLGQAKSSNIKKK